MIIELDVDVWENSNGWHWGVDTDNWCLTSGRTHRTAEHAIRSARAVCAKLCPFVRIGEVTVRKLGPD